MDNRYAQQIVDALNELLRKHGKFNSNIEALLELNLEAVDNSRQKIDEINKSVGNVSQLFLTFANKNNDVQEKSGAEQNEKIFNEKKFAAINDIKTVLNIIADFTLDISANTEKQLSTLTLMSERIKRTNEYQWGISTILKAGFASQIAAMAAESGVKDSTSISNLAKGSPESLADKLQRIYQKERLELSNKDKNESNKKTSGTSPEVLKVFTDSMKGIASTIKDFVQSAILFSQEVKGKIDPSDIPSYLISIYTDITRKIDINEMKNAGIIFKDIQAVLTSLTSFGEKIKASVYPSLMFAYHLGIGKLMGKLITQISIELTKVKSLSKDSINSINSSTEVINSIKDFSLNIAKVYSSLIFAKTFPVGKLYTSLIISVIKHLSKINKMVVEQSLTYASNAINVVKGLVEITNQLKEANKKIISVILLGVGQRAAFMLKSIIRSLNGVKPISKEGMASIDFVKHFLTEDIRAIGVSSFATNFLLTFMSKNSFANKLKSLFSGISEALVIFLKNEDLMNDQKRNKLYEIFGHLGENLLKFVTDINKINKNLGSVKDVEKLEQKIIKFNTTIKHIIDVFKELGDDTLVIEKTQNSLEKINISIRGISGMIISLAALTVLIPFASAGLLFVNFTMKMFKFIGTFAKEINRGAIVVKKVGQSLLLFSLGAAIFALTMSKIIGPFTLGLLTLGITAYLFTLIGLAASTIKKAAQAVAWIGIGLAAFAVGIFLLSTAVSLNPIGVIAGIAVLGAYALTFFFIGKFTKEIAKGSLAVIAMSIGLAFFTAGIVLYGLGLKLYNWETLGMGLALLGGMALLMGIMGAIGLSQIAKGALATTLMGISLAIFSVGTFLYGLAIKQFTLETLGMGLALLGGMAIVLGLIGAFGTTALIGAAIVAAIGISLIPFSIGVMLLGKAINNWTLEKLGMSLVLIGGIITLLGVAGVLGATAFIGAAIVTAIGLSLIPFSIGLNLLAKIPKLEDDQILNLGKMFAILTGSFSLMGLASVFILPGVAAAIGIGAGLSSIVYGLKKSTEIDWPKVPIDDIKRVIVGLGEAFAAVGASNAGGVGGLLLKTLSFGLIGPNKVKDGINSVLNASKALISVAEGVKAFESMTNNLNFDTIEKDGLNVPAPGSVPFRISTVLGMINKSFSDIGASGNSGFSLMKLVFGSDFKKSDAEVGIKSVLNAGKALMSVAEGVKAFDDMTNNLDFRTIGNEYPSEPAPGSVPHKIATIIGVINKIFSDIGQSGNTGFSLVKLVFGSDFKKSDTEVGIKSVLSAGTALSEIAKGVKDFDKFSSDMNFDPNDENSIQNKITKILGTISAVFAGIANQNEGASIGGSFLGLLTGLNIGGNDVSRGIDSVKDVGKVFTEMATGLKQWQNLTTAGYDMKKIMQNISDVILAVAKTFAEIGKLDDSGWFADGDVSNGIDAVSGVGDVVSGISNGVKAFADLQKMGFPADSFNINKKGSITSNIKDIVLTVAEVFARIGKGDIYDSENVENGIKALSGVGKEFDSIAKGIKTFGDLKKDNIDLNVIKVNIREVILTIADVFGKIGKDNANIKQAEIGIKSISGVGAELEAISKSLQPYVDLQKGENKINVKQLKENIKELVSVNIETVANIGKIYGNSDLISRGSEIIKVATEGLNPIQELINKFKSYKIEEWQNIKEIMSEAVSEPFNVFKSVFDIWSQISTKWDSFISTSITPLPKHIENLATGYSNVKTTLLSNSNKDVSNGPVRDMLNVYSSAIKEITSWNFTEEIKNKLILLGELEHKLMETSIRYKIIHSNLESLRLGEDGPLQLMSSDMERFIKIINNSDIKKIRMNQMNEIIRFIERLSMQNDPFKKFADRFKEHVNDIGKYIKEINSIKEQPFKQFLDLNTKVIELVKSDTNKIKENLQAVTQALQEINQTAQMPSMPEQNNSGFLGSVGNALGNLFGGSTQPTIQQNNQTQSQSSNKDVTSLLMKISNQLESVISGGVIRVMETGD